jgi:DNA polymerase-3 subunit epsilon
MTAPETTPWWEGPLLGFDLETTSPIPTEARIVTVALVFSPSPGIFVSLLSLLVNPGCDIPAEATAVHGITTDQARDEGCPEAHAAGLVLDALALPPYEGPLVIFNAPFDWTLLHATCRRHDLPLPPSRLIIDPLVIDRRLDKWRKGARKLGAMAEHYRVSLTDAHDAGADAIAAIGVARALAQKYFQHDGMVTHNAESLTHSQAVWFAEWRRDFMQYLVKQGKPADVPAGWPLQEGLTAR